MFTIEKGKETPQAKRNRYPWAEMEVGDSFMVPCKTELETERALASTRFAGYIYFKRRATNKSVIARKVKGGVRVWVTKKQSGAA